MTVDALGTPIEEYKNEGIKAAFGVAGVLTMLGSIPLFIASWKNKRKAASFLLIT